MSMAIRRPVPELNINRELERLPNPTPEDLESPIFNAIWNIIKDWDLRVPKYHTGYSGASGSHAKLILDEVKIAIRDKKIDDILDTI